MPDAPTDPPAPASLAIAGRHGPPAALPAFLIDSREAARLCGIGKSLFYWLLATERFGPKPLRLGRAVRFSRIEIEQWIAAGAPPRARWEGMRGGRR
jgi:predicted DNA-binding transcriptional regulator AlpA